MTTAAETQPLPNCTGTFALEKFQALRAELAAYGIDEVNGRSVSIAEAMIAEATCDPQRCITDRQGCERQRLVWPASLALSQAVSIARQNTG